MSDSSSRSMCCLITSEAAAQIEAPEARFRLGYRPWLDGIRGLSLLLVVFTHLKLMSGGNWAMDVFFVLSGFLITSLLVEEWQCTGKIDFKQFYLRRALRLMPAFAVLLLVYCVYVLAILPTEQWLDRAYEFAAVACYVANWPSYHGITISCLGHTWSLSVEEQFYLLWPVLLWLMIRSWPRRRLLVAVLAGIFASALWRLILHQQHHLFGAERLEYTRLYTGLDTRADSLLVGCLASLLMYGNLLPRTVRFQRGLTVAATAGGGIIAFCVLRRDLSSSQNYDGLLTLVAFATGIIFLRMLTAPAGIITTVLESRPLVYFGRISYGCYLFHMPIIEWVPWGTIGWSNLPVTLFLGLLSLLAGMLSYHFVEAPFLRLKERLHASTKTHGNDAKMNSDAPSRIAA